MKDYSAHVKADRCPTCGCAWKAWSAPAIIEAAQKWNDEHGRFPSTRDWACYTVDHPGRRTIIRMFGNWTNMVLAAGGVPRQPRVGLKRWHKDQVAEAMLDFLLVNGRWPTTGDWRKATATHPCKDQVARMFGTWNAAKTYAGWDPEASSRPLRQKLCQGCDCELNEYVPGCSTCDNRRHNRTQRARRAAEKSGSARILSASPLIEDDGATGAEPLIIEEAA